MQVKITKAPTNINPFGNPPSLDSNSGLSDDISMRFQNIGPFPLKLFYFYLYHKKKHLLDKNTEP